MHCYLFWVQLWHNEVGQPDVYKVGKFQCAVQDSLEPSLALRKAESDC